MNKEGVLHGHVPPLADSPLHRTLCLRLPDWCHGRERPGVGRRIPHTHTHARARTHTQHAHVLASQLVGVPHAPRRLATLHHPSDATTTNPHAVVKPHWYIVNKHHHHTQLPSRTCTPINIKGETAVVCKPGRTRTRGSAIILPEV